MLVEVARGRMVLHENLYLGRGCPTHSQTRCWNSSQPRARQSHYQVSYLYFRTTEATEGQFPMRHMTVRGLGSYQSFSMLDMGEIWMYLATQPRSMLEVLTQAMTATHRNTIIKDRFLHARGHPRPVCCPSIISPDSEGDATAENCQ